MDFLREYIKWVRCERKMPYRSNYDIHFAYTKYDHADNTMYIIGKGADETRVLRIYRIPNPEVKYLTTLELLKDELQSDKDIMSGILRMTSREYEQVLNDINHHPVMLPTEEPTFYIVMGEDGKAITYPGSDAVRIFGKKKEAQSKALSMNRSRTGGDFKRAVGVMATTVKYSRVQILCKGNFKKRGEFIYQVKQ